MRAFPVILLLIGMLLISACGGTAADTGIAPQEPVLVEEGETLFASNCAACHGEDLRGTDQGPSLLSEVYVPSHHSDGSFLLAVQNGSPAHHWDFGDMPPVEGLTTEDVEAIVAYVREQQRINGFEPYPP